MGIGFCLVLPENAVADALTLCQSLGLPAWCIGEVQASEGNTPEGVLGLPA